MAELSALDALLCNASSVRLSEVDRAGGELVVDLSRADERDRLRAAMTVASLPGYACACRGQVRFEFLDARGDSLADVFFHHGISLAWRGWRGHGELANGEGLVRWLAEHGISSAPGSDVRPERLDWLAAIPPALDELTDQLLGHFKRTRDSSLVTKARRLLLTTEPVSRVLQLLVWCGSGTGRQSGYPPHEGIPGLILSHVPIAEIVTALEDPRANGRHDAGAARHLFDGSREKQRLDVARLPGPLRIRVREAAEAKGYELPQWAERLLLNA